MPPSKKRHHDSGDDEADDSGKSENKEMSKSEIIQKCQDAYDKAQDALKSGDWAKYGKYMDELEKYLNKLQ